jgi:hypothetical protein
MQPRRDPACADAPARSAFVRASAADRLDLGSRRDGIVAHAAIDMNTATRALASLLAELEGMPAFLASAASRVAPGDVRTPPADGSFSFVEQVWHLADLEREGYGVRVRRILSEEEPELADFDGAQVALERRYRELDPQDALRTFTRERTHNIDALRRATPAQLARGATQAGVGRITLADVPRMMAEHDRAHRLEIQELLAVLARRSPGAR